MGKKELLFSVTLADCRVDTYRGSGKGGQKRNKTSSAVRVTHEPSGAVGQSEDGRSQLHNKKLAFSRMARSDKMTKWLRHEAARRSGELTRIQDTVDREMSKVRVETRDDRGKWIVNRELARGGAYNT